MTGWNGLDSADSIATDAENANQGRVSLTLKSDGAYDAPWYVIHGNNAAEVKAQLEDPALRDLLMAATNVSTNWAKAQASAKGLTPVSQQPARQDTGSSYQNSAASGAADSQAPICEHGPREWKDFTSKAGNHVKGWFCTTRNSNCSPMYAK